MKRDEKLARVAFDYEPHRLRDKALWAVIVAITIYAVVFA